MLHTRIFDGGVHELDAALARATEAGDRLIEAGGDGAPAGVFRQPGATLSHVAALAAGTERLVVDVGHEPRLDLVRDRWIEVAAGLVFAVDAYEGIAEHEARWERVAIRAGERLRTITRPAGTAAPGALIGSAALAFAGRWLDELNGWSARPSAAELVEEVVELAAIAIEAAMLAEGDRTATGSRS